MLLTQTGWLDYELLDAGDEKKLEKYGSFVIERPCKEAAFPPEHDSNHWQRDAFFDEATQRWQFLKSVPENWPLHWNDLTFIAECAPYKHMGIFPEQSAHWQWMRELLLARKKLQPETSMNILNLFAYTGCASVVAAHTGARVTHVDASRSAIGMAKQNQASSGLSDRSIRWILDDVLTFVQREVRRGVQYDGIILDPPAFGHGPKGERWQLQRSLPQLLELCSHILTAQPLFILLNVYAGGMYEAQVKTLLSSHFKKLNGRIYTGELCLETSATQQHISTGIWGRWEA
jgi:23S rRNA (cytosine1962-C5)-methyltransferase